jgi:hypothetical protein
MKLRRYNSTNSDKIISLRFIIIIITIVIIIITISVNNIVFITDKLPNHFFINQNKGKTDDFSAANTQMVRKLSTF